MDKAKAPNSQTVLLFMDASHFVMGNDFLGSIYGKVRRFVKSFSGRKRYNVLGAIDYVTKKVSTVTNITYITATEICVMLKKMAAEYSGKEIHIALDNARYQKCQIVTEMAKTLGIDLVYIPPYSPNLNLIERLWKLVKGELRCRYYDDFKLFSATIDGIIDGTESRYKQRIENLIGEKVQLYDDLMKVCDNTFILPVSQEKEAA